MSPRTKRTGSRTSAATKTSSSTSSKTTTNHDEIRKWAEERDGKPAVVESTTKSSKGGGIIRIDFPGYTGGKSLKKNQLGSIFQAIR